jgi:UDP-N-acetylmuramoyl-L-alanyl-D-glutamate--2,6-diaminopimelate ligase
MPTISALSKKFNYRVIGDPDTQITGISYDSRVVKPGDLFCCIRGKTVNGHEYIDEVMSKGAVAVLVDNIDNLPPCASAILCENTTKAIAEISAEFYGNPSDMLKVIGVTGTNGKTTVTTVLWGILQQCGHKTGLIGTIAYIFDDEVIPAKHTTPQSADLQQLLARMANSGHEYVVMEVSSHALCQHRITGCKFSAVAMTNITQDHLDFHKSIEKYQEAKLTLFNDEKYHHDSYFPAVINADDPASLAFINAVNQPVTYGITNGMYRAKNLSLKGNGTTFTLVTPEEEFPVDMQLVGTFNVYNALAALTLAIKSGVSAIDAVAALRNIPPVDGRFQAVPAVAGAPTVIVDYAHTPDGLDKILAAAHDVAPGRITVLFGCGGDRDRDKRPKMAVIAAKWAEKVIVTSDNPRSEDPDSIIAEIMKGFTDADLGKVTAITDRATAIRTAILQSSPDDIIILAGKGHEDYQEFADKKRIHFDDREEAGKALAEYGENKNNSN